MSTVESHGKIALSIAACTSCNACVVDCPAWCITLASHTEAVTGAGRPRKVKVLDEFTIDYGLCIFCGICIEVCPFDALAWRESPIDATASREELVTTMQTLNQWW